MTNGKHIYKNSYRSDLFL